MRIVITGCRGFIGGSLGVYAAAAGHRVLGIGRSSQAPTGWRGEYLAADVAHADLAPVFTEFAPDVIFHAAGSASVASSFGAPHEDLRATVQTFGNTLDAARRSGVKPVVIFPSSAAVYGNPETLPVREDARANPVSPYGFHKVMCETLGREYAECFGLRVLLFRLFSVYGPAQRRLLVWQIFEQLANNAPEVVLEGTGDETRDYLYIDDLAALTLALGKAASERRDEPGCAALNLGSGSSTKVGDLAREMAARHPSRKAVRCAGAARRGDPQKWAADVTLLRAAAPGISPRPLAEGLEACLRAWS